MNAISREFAMTLEPGPLNQRDLRDAFGRFATGVTVITAQCELGPLAMTANSFSSISLDPPLVMWAAATGSKRYPAFAAAQHYAIHVLAADQADLCRTFSADGLALAQMPHDVNEHNAPLIDGCLARFECRQSALHQAGDHTIIMGEVQRASLRDGQPLTFYGGKFSTVEGS